MSDKDQAPSPREQRLQRERQQRRDEIIQTAEWFFTNHGYEQTMVDNIALKAGYSKATLYNYFDSKDDLFIAVVSKAFEKLLQVMQETFQDPDSKYELLTLGYAYLSFVEDYPNYAKLFEGGRLTLVLGKIITKQEMDLPLTESEKEFRKCQSQIENLMMTVITKTLEDSGVVAKVDPFSVIMALSSLGSAINDLVMRGKKNQTEDKSREYITVLFNIIDKGLKHYDD
jgi:AcrR family transcriptional regulator